MIRQTTLETFNQIVSEGLLSKRREETYKALYEYGPCTANEPFRAWKVRTFITQQNIHPRLGELRDLGVVIEIEERSCKVTGRKAIVWKTTDKLPTKQTKHKKIKCKHCNGKVCFEDKQIILF